MKFKRIEPTMLALALAMTAVQLPAPAQPAVNDPYQALVKREFGTAADSLAAIEKEIKEAKLEDRAAIETKLITVLNTPDATMAGKQFACTMLRLVGSTKSVPALGGLLTDVQLSHVARIALQGISGPDADTALREALAKTKGPVRIGLINTIGDRGDAGSLAALTPLLAGGDEATTDSALAAIAKIGGAKAADALDAAKVPDTAKAAWAQAYLRCAGSLTGKGETARAQKMCKSLLDGNHPPHVRAGAFREIVMDQKEKAVPMIVQNLGSTDRYMRRAALSAVISVPGKAATVALGQQLAAQTPEGKITLLAALATRGDGEGLADSVNKLAASDDADVRAAAISALGRLGNASSVPVLVAALKDPANGANASRALGGLRGEGVAAGLIKLVESGDAALRSTVLALMADRKQIEALPVARKLANDGDATLRNSAIKVISALGTQEDLQSLSDAMLTKRNDGDQLAGAIKEIGVRLPDKTKRDATVLTAFEKADAPTKVQLLPVLLSFAGNQTLQAARGALAGDGEVHKVAVRTLALWPDSAPLADLRKVAKDDADNAVRILALRGVIGMVGKSGLKTEEKVQALKEAMEMSTRNEEKRQVLGEIGRIGHPDSLKVVEPALADDGLKREALQAYFQIADALVDRQPAIAKEALQKVLAATTDNGLKEKATAALRRIK